MCSFLVRDMGIDWRMGAEWFETCLLDYDPCSNYGNWTYGAGDYGNCLLLLASFRFVYASISQAITSIING